MVYIYPIAEHLVEMLGRLGKFLTKGCMEVFMEANREIHLTFMWEGNQLMWSQTPPTCYALLCMVFSRHKRSEYGHYPAAAMDMK